MNATPKKVTAADVTFELTTEPEQESPEGQFSEREDVEYVHAQIRAGNDWAWCCAKVTAKWEGFEGVDYLGGCAYADEADFRKGVYFDDMKAQALDDLNDQIAAMAAKLAPLL